LLPYFYIDIFRTEIILV